MGNAGNTKDVGIASGKPRINVRLNQSASYCYSCKTAAPELPLVAQLTTNYRTNPTNIIRITCNGMGWVETGDNMQLSVLLCRCKSSCSMELLQHNFSLKKFYPFPDLTSLNSRT